MEVKSENELMDSPSSPGKKSRVRKHYRDDRDEKREIIVQDSLKLLCKKAESKFKPLPQDDFIVKKVLLINTTSNLVYSEDDPNILKFKSLEMLLKENNYICDRDYTAKHGFDGYFFTPISQYKRRTLFKVMDFKVLFEGSDLNYEYITQLGALLEENYEKYDSFIIFQGPTTITYTASFLSFMLEHLNKTVIITGSQLPFSVMRNDAFDNILNSLIIAGHFLIPEVLVLFTNKVFRGNRTTCYDSNGFDFISSPNYPVLSEFGVNVDFDWTNILKPDHKQFKLNKSLCENIAQFKLQPLYKIEALEAVLRTPGLRALIIESYIGGHFPSNNKRLMELLEEAYKNNILIVNVSQGFKYNNLSENENIINTADMTFEAALAKTSHLLGIPENLSKEQIAVRMALNLRGEITPINQGSLNFSTKDERFLDAIHDSIQDKNFENSELMRSIILPNIVCQMANFGNVFYLQELKPFGVKFSIADYDGRTALHIGSREKNLGMVKYLIQEGCNPNAIDMMGRSPMYEAVLKKDKKVIYELKKLGAKIHPSEELWNNLIIRSAHANDLDTIQLIYHCGLKNLNEFTNIEGRNIGHIAAAEGHLELLKFLKKIYFDFYAKDLKGRTPNDDALFSQNKDVIAFFSEFIV